jgi:AcrR family transcriptional regulator
LFVTKGWFGTGMRDVATEAGVATETLYGHFSSKRKLLEHVVDDALVGHSEAIATHPDFGAIGRGTHRQRALAAARVHTEIYGRTAALARVTRQASASDDRIAEILNATRERQREDISSMIFSIAGREPTPAERDGIWALTSPEVYLLLVENSAWSADQFQSWMAETLERVIPARRPTRRKGRDKAT